MQKFIGIGERLRICDINNFHAIGFDIVSLTKMLFDFDNGIILFNTVHLEKRAHQEFGFH